MSIVLAPTRPESSKSSVFSGRPERPHGAWHAARELGIPDKQQEVEASSLFLSPDDLLQGRFPFSQKLAVVYAHNSSSSRRRRRRRRGVYRPSKETEQNKKGLREKSWFT